MTGIDRAALAEKALAGYPHGPDAPQAALAAALERIPQAELAVLVEGISDQIAIETLGLRSGVDLAAASVVVVPIGGAQAAFKFMSQLGPSGRGLPLVGFCDVDAAETYRRALVRADVGSPADASAMESLGFKLCVRDLEDELIRSVGVDVTLAVIESQGELGSFRTMQKQVEWRGRNVDDQLHRFIRSHARRSQRYARLLIDVADPDHAPQPLRAVLADVMAIIGKATT